MSRLIDADKYLEKVCTYKETGCGSCKLQTMCPKEAPTVNAIPIKWFESKQTSGKLSFADCAAVEDLLNEWEKENEQV